MPTAVQFHKHSLASELHGLDANSGGKNAREKSVQRTATVRTILALAAVMVGRRSLTGAVLGMVMAEVIGNCG